MDTKKVAIKRAIALLQAAGAQFKIIADGEEHGELVVAAVKMRTRKPTGIDFKALYREKLQAMMAGDTAKVIAPAGVPVESLRATMAAWASTHWGKGNAITTINGHEVEILRVA